MQMVLTVLTHRTGSTVSLRVGVEKPEGKNFQVG